MDPDIILGHCSEDSIAYRVEKHIAIGMAEKALFKRDLNTAEDKLSSVHKAMNIETYPYPHTLPLSCESRPRAIIRSSGVVIFILYGEPSMTFTFLPRCSTNVASSYP